MKIIDKIKIIWETDRYDGPLSGVCEFEGSRHYFNIIDEMDKNNKDKENLFGCRLRLFGIYKLTESEMSSVIYWHNEFRKYVGTHTDYTETKGKVHPQSSHHKFYDAYKKREKRLMLTNDKLVVIYAEMALYD